IRAEHRTHAAEERERPAEPRGRVDDVGHPARSHAEADRMPVARHRGVVLQLEMGVAVERLPHLVAAADKSPRHVDAWREVAQRLASVLEKLKARFIYDGGP